MFKTALKKIVTHFTTPNQGQGAFSPIRMKKSPTIRSDVHQEFSMFINNFQRISKNSLKQFKMCFNLILKPL